MLLFGACAKKDPDMVNATDSASEVPLYHRKTTEIPLRKDANTYCMDFGKAGFFYYVMEEIMDKEPQEDRTDYSEQGFCYRFYYQSYDGKEAVPFCEISEGYVRGFSHIERENQGKFMLSFGRMIQETQQSS